MGSERWTIDIIVIIRYNEDTKRDGFVRSIMNLANKYIKEAIVW